MKRVLILLLIFSNSILLSQNVEYLKGEIINVNKINEYVLLDSSSNQIRIFLTDTRETANDSLKILAHNYLNDRILNKEVYFKVERKEDNSFFGSLMFDCQKTKGSTFSKNEVPCSSGIVLNVELIRRNYIDYTGTNDFLLKLSKGIDPW